MRTPHSAGGQTTQDHLTSGTVFLQKLTGVFTHVGCWEEQVRFYVYCFALSAQVCFLYTDKVMILWLVDGHRVCDIYLAETKSVINRQFFLLGSPILSVMNNSNGDAPK